jgi:hypothetical protein
LPGILTDYSDLGNVLVEAFAYMGDIMSHYIDRAANETAVDTAIKRDTLLNFANLYGYRTIWSYSGYSGSYLYKRKRKYCRLAYRHTVLAPLSSRPISEVYFETTSAAVGILPGQSITLPAVEGKTVNTDRPDLIDSVYNKPLPTNVGLTQWSS